MQLQRAAASGRKASSLQLHSTACRQLHMHRMRVYRWVRSMTLWRYRMHHIYITGHGAAEDG